MFRNLLAVGLLASSCAPAFAVSQAVKDACQDDYMALCSQHEVGTEGLRSCMRSNKKQLSKHCATTLAKSGEASKADIESYKRETK